MSLLPKVFACSRRANNETFCEPTIPRGIYELCRAHPFHLFLQRLVTSSFANALEKFSYYTGSPLSFLIRARSRFLDRRLHASRILERVRESCDVFMRPNWVGQFNVVPSIFRNVVSRHPSSIHQPSSILPFRSSVPIAILNAGCESVVG